MPKSKTKNKKRRQERAAARLEPKPISLADQIGPAVLNVTPPQDVVVPELQEDTASCGSLDSIPTDDLPPLSAMAVEIAGRWPNGLTDFERIRRA